MATLIECHVGKGPLMSGRGPSRRDGAPQVSIPITVIWVTGFDKLNGIQAEALTHSCPHQSIEFDQIPSARGPPVELRMVEAHIDATPQKRASALRCSSRFAPAVVSMSACHQKSLCDPNRTSQFLNLAAGDNSSTNTLPRWPPGSRAFVRTKVALQAEQGLR